MATTTLAGLFSDYLSPQQARQQQQQANLQAMGRISDPRQFVAMGATNLGAGVGRMLFPFDNSVEQNVDEVLGAVSNIQDPLAQAQEAYRIFSQKGMNKEAQSVLSLTRSLEKEKTNLQNETTAKENRVKAVLGINSELDPEVATMIGSDKDLFNKFVSNTVLAKKDKPPSVGTTAELISQVKFGKYFNELSQTEKEAVYKEAEKEVSLGTGLASLAKALSQEAGKGMGKDVAENVSSNKLQGKANAIASLQRAKKLINAGIYTGGFAGAKMAGSKYTPFGSQKKLENTEKYSSHVSTTVIPLLKEFGGNDSNQELEFLEKLVGADITLEEATLIELVDTAIRKQEEGLARDIAAFKAVIEGKVPSIDVTPPTFGGAASTPIGVGETTTVNGVTIKRVK
jgi:hypothetical protein